MLPNFLVAETEIREDGEGPQFELGSAAGKQLLLTLGITKIIEQESLDVSFWVSKDGEDWGAKPLVSFPQKFYCGTYQILFDLQEQPEIKFLRPQWKVGRWGHGTSKPLFAFYVYAEESPSTAVASRTA